MLGDVHSTLIEALCYRRALRVAGFSEKEIAIAYDATVGECAMVATRDGREFIAQVAASFPFNVGTDHFYRAWSEACDQWANLTAGEQRTVYQASFVATSFHVLLDAMRARGFEVTPLVLVPKIFPTRRDEEKELEMRAYGRFSYWPLARNDRTHTRQREKRTLKKYARQEEPREVAQGLYDHEVREDEYDDGYDFSWDSDAPMYSEYYTDPIHYGCSHRPADIEWWRTYDCEVCRDWQEHVQRIHPRGWPLGKLEDLLKEIQ